MTEKKQLGRILLKQRAISPEELEKELHAGGGRLASRLTEKGTISGLAALKALSEQHGIPGIDLEQVCVKLSDLDLLPREIAQRHLILPVLSRGERLFVAMAHPKEKKVIGPRCPAETLAKLGLSAEDIAQMSEPLPTNRQSSLPPPPPGLVEGPLGDVAGDVTETDDGAEDLDASLTLPGAAQTGSARVGTTGLELEDIGEEPEPNAGLRVATIEPSGPPSSDPVLIPIDASESQGRMAPAPVPTVTYKDHFADADDTPLPPQKSRSSSSPSKRSLTPPLGHQPLGVTLDKTADEPDVSDEDFGDLNSELSVVMDIPPKPSGGPAVVHGTILVVDDEAEIRRLLERLLV